MNSIEKFFLPPCPVSELPQELVSSGERPVLHLLRRDLEHLYLKENRFGPDGNDTHKAPYLAAMGILTGIDMMAKFYNDSGRPGVIFKRFLQEVCGVSYAEAKFAWEFRNALHHSYSLDLGILSNTVFTTEVANVHWYSVSNGEHRVTLWGLKRFFFFAIEKYKALLTSNSGLRDNFEQHYLKSGRIFVVSHEKRPA